MTCHIVLLMKMKLRTRMWMSMCMSVAISVSVSETMSLSMGEFSYIDTCPLYQCWSLPRQTNIPPVPHIGWSRSCQPLQPWTWQGVSCISVWWLARSELHSIYHIDHVNVVLSQLYWHTMLSRTAYIVMAIEYCDWNIVISISLHSWVSLEVECWIMRLGECHCMSVADSPQVYTQVHTMWFQMHCMKSLWYQCY